MKSSFTQIYLFNYVVEMMSFTKAAEHLKLSKSYVSQQIAALEKTLGVKLLERTTRHIAPTFAGTQLYEHSRRIVQELNNAEQTIAGLQNKPEGQLRITAPSAFAAHILAPALPQFLDRYPEIDLKIITTGVELDLLKEKIDIAIRLTHNPPEDRVAKLLGYYQLQVCATPRFLKNRNEIKQPHNISEHPCLVYATEKVSERWPFIIDEKESPVFVTPHMACNTYEILLNAVLSDCGIARLPSYVIQQSVEKNALKILFEQYEPPKIPIYAIYAPDPHFPPRNRVFLEFSQNITTKGV